MSETATTKAADGVARDGGTVKDCRRSSCSGCGRAIVDRFLLYAMERHWHVGCLRCSVCQTPLDDAVATCYTRAGLILCRSDYLRSLRLEPPPSSSYRHDFAALYQWRAQDSIFRVG